MLYDLPARMSAIPVGWPEQGIGSIPARLPDGRLVQVPVLQGANMLVTGTTGAGKTVFTKAVVQTLLDNSRDMLAVFFQIKPDDFTGIFFRPGDKLVTYSPSVASEKDLFRWNMVREIRQSSDKDAALKQLGTALFRHLLEDPRHRLWAGAARDTFTGFLRVIVDCYSDSPTNRQVVHTLRTTKTADLLRYLSKHSENHSLLEKSFGFDLGQPDKPYTPTRRAEDILFFLNDVLMLFGGNFLSDGEDTVNDFLRKPGQRLFFLHDLTEEAASRPFELFLLESIINAKMSPSTNLSTPVLLVLDEADKIGGEFGLQKAATLGRGYGLQTIVSTQSMESLFALSSKENREHETTASLSGFPILAAFHCGDPSTMRTQQALFGSQRKESTTLPLSRYDSIVCRSEVEPVVSDLELASLQTGECFIKILSHLPQKVSIDPIVSIK